VPGSRCGLGDGPDGAAYVACNPLKYLVFLAFATIASPASANAGESIPANGDLLPSVWVEAWGGNSFVDTCCGADTDDDEYPAFGGAARASLPFGEALSMQLDVEGQRNLPTENAGTSNFQHFIGGGGHLSYRHPDSYLVGLFAGGGEANGGDGDGSGLLWLAGVEAQYYFDQFTVYGQAGYLDSHDAGDDNFQEAFFLRGVGRYFPTDQSKVTIDLQFASGKIDDGCGGVLEFCDGHLFSWAARYDQAISESPVSFFVAYRGFTNVKDGLERDRAFENTFLAGLSIAFGTPSLKALDRQGATLDLPDAGRWVGYTTEVLD